MKNTLFLMLLLLMQCTPQKKEQDTNNASGHDTPAPAFTRLDGTQFQLSEFHGKRVVLNFWATWCKPCIAEMPSIERAQQQLGTSVVFVLASDESIDRIGDFVEKNPFQLSLVYSERPLEGWGVSTMPTSIIFDEQGVEVTRITGERDWASKEMMAIITEGKK